MWEWLSVYIICLKSLKGTGLIFTIFQKPFTSSERLLQFFLMGGEKLPSMKPLKIIMSWTTVNLHKLIVFDHCYLFGHVHDCN